MVDDSPRHFPVVTERRPYLDYDKMTDEDVAYMLERICRHLMDHGGIILESGTAESSALIHAWRRFRKQDN